MDVVGIDLSYPSMALRSRRLNKGTRSYSKYLKIEPPETEDKLKGRFHDGQRSSTVTDFDFEVLKVLSHSL